MDPWMHVYTHACLHTMCACMASTYMRMHVYTCMPYACTTCIWHGMACMPWMHAMGYHTWHYILCDMHMCACSCICMHACTVMDDQWCTRDMIQCIHTIWFSTYMQCMASVACNAHVHMHVFSCMHNVLTHDMVIRSCMHKWHDSCVSHNMGHGLHVWTIAFLGHDMHGIYMPCMHGLPNAHIFMHAHWITHDMIQCIPHNLIQHYMVWM